MPRDIFPQSVVTLLVGGGVALVLVEHTFFLDWFRSPFGVSSVLE